MLRTVKSSIYRARTGVELELTSEIEVDAYYEVGLSVDAKLTNPYLDPALIKDSRLNNDDLLLSCTDLCAGSSAFEGYLGV